MMAIYKARLKGFVRQIQPAYLTALFELDETVDGATVSTSAGAIIERVKPSGNNGTAFGTLTGRADYHLNALP